MLSVVKSSLPLGVAFGCDIEATVVLVSVIVIAFISSFDDDDVLLLSVLEAMVCLTES